LSLSTILIFDFEIARTVLFVFHIIIGIIEHKHIILMK